MIQPIHAHAGAENDESHHKVSGKRLQRGDESILQLIGISLKDNILNVQ
jgi:hypothetical protein